MRTSLIVFLLVVTFQISCTTKDDTDIISEIFTTAQEDSTSYHSLRLLTDSYGKRLAGTPVSAAAVDFIKGIMENSGFDTVYLQECTVAHWKRGDKEEGGIISTKTGKTRIAVCTLGNSVGTQGNGLIANVIEVKSFEELAVLGNNEKVEGKIVFFNKPMDPAKTNTFQAYGEVVGFRFAGASEAAKYGAVAVLVRSSTAATDTFPHTGVMRYFDTSNKIPAFSVSTYHANQLSKMLEEDPKLKVFLKSDCRFLPDEKSYNVVGEVFGNEFPDEIITVGGHLDCWDNSDGAHDDGGGCVQSIDVWRIMNQVGYEPKRTLRVVMFMDEEMNQRGGRKYAELARLNNEKHLFALESDAGCDRPVGFSIESDTTNFVKVLRFKKFFEPYGINVFMNGGSGVDIGFLKEHHTVLTELITDPAHYFDYHHSGFDTFDKINKSDLLQGSAAMTSLIFLVDKHGLPE